MRPTRRYRLALRARRLTVLLTCAVLLALATVSLPVRDLAAAPASWRDTGIDLPDIIHSSPETGLCIDPTRPHTIVVSQEDGAYVYDWTVGPASRWKINGVVLRGCSGASGLYYGVSAGQSMRFSLDAPTPQPIDRLAQLSRRG